MCVREPARRRTNGFARARAGEIRVYTRVQLATRKNSLDLACPHVVTVRVYMRARARAPAAAGARAHVAHARAGARTMKNGFKKTFIYYNKNVFSTNHFLKTIIARARVCLRARARARARRRARARAESSIMLV